MSTKAARVRYTLGLVLAASACGDETTATSGDSTGDEASGSSSTDAPTTAIESSGPGPDTSATAPTAGPETSGDPETGSSSGPESSGEGAPASCGDGQLDPGELCDDGNDDEQDDCTTLCLPPACGDGIVQDALGESCDDGNDDPFDACPIDCGAAVCGDGVREGIEEVGSPGTELEFAL